MTKAARPSLVRSVNDTLVCGYLRDTPGMSRGDIARRLGVSAPAVLKIMDRLQRAGVVRAVGTEELTRPGPRATLYGLEPAYGVITGIHVRHRELRVSHRALDGSVVAELTVSFDDAGDLAEHIARAALSPHPRRPQSVVVALPGAIDPVTGDVLLAEELPYWQTGTAERIRRLLPHVAFDREINLRAEAEHQRGAAQGRNDFLLISYGSGIGAALFLDGALRAGAHGATGEVGYAPAPWTPSGTTYQDVAGAWDLAPLLGGTHEPQYAWLHAAAQSEQQEVWDTLAAQLSPGLLAMVTLVDPGLVVLSGEVAKIAGAPLLAAVQRWFAQHCHMAAPDIALSTLGDQAVLEGAWVRGWRTLIEQAVA